MILVRSLHPPRARRKRCDTSHSDREADPTALATTASRSLVVLSCQKVDPRWWSW